MKTLPITAVPLALLALAVSASGAESFRTDINPALLYYQSFLVAPQAMANEDFDYLYARDSRIQLPDKFGKIAEDYDRQFKLVRRAAHSTVPCDWGIDLSDGPDALLPHLARAKAVAQATRVRVLWDLQNGRQEDAQADLVAAVVLGRNASSDGTIISILVQLAVESIEYSTLAETFGHFTPAALQHLEEGLAAAPARRTFAQGIEFEDKNFRGWLVNKIKGYQQAHPGDDAKVLEEIHALLPSFQNPDKIESGVWERLLRAAGNTSDGILKLLEAQQSLKEEFAHIVALPYAQADPALKEFTKRVDASTNPFVSLTFPPIAQSSRREFRVQVWEAMVKAAIEYQLHGESGFKAVRDPCGNGPFTMERFHFGGVDRGFILKSSYTGSGFPEVLIFVETDGMPFYVDGPKAGKARAPASTPK